MERGATQQQAGRLRHHVPGDLWPMIVGCIPIAALVWIASYLPLVRAIAVVQERRRARREARLRHLHEATPPE